MTFVEDDRAVHLSGKADTSYFGNGMWLSLMDIIYRGERGLPPISGVLL
jgi:hypothetical protein